MYIYVLMCGILLGCAVLGSENDEMAVTDPQCRVYGLESLRVVDASIMPKVTTGNLNGKLVIVKSSHSTQCRPAVKLVTICRLSWFVHVSRAGADARREGGRHHSWQRSPATQRSTSLSTANAWNTAIGRSNRSYCASTDDVTECIIVYVNQAREMPWLIISIKTGIAFLHIQSCYQLCHNINRFCLLVDSWWFCCVPVNVIGRYMCWSLWWSNCVE